jgi:1,4-dihydroxy-2-naphthoate polyprenyltransferase
VRYRIVNSCSIAVGCKSYLLDYTFNVTETQNKPLSYGKKWLLAARPRTLPAAVAPVLAASALAFHAGKFALVPALAALFGALLIQIGANFSNDLFDFKQGVDTQQRMGPTRVTQAGLLSQTQMIFGTILVFGFAAVCGVYLTWVAGWAVIVMGLLSIAAALAYTAGPYPLGYNGLGEVFVFLFFGLVAVMGTYYVQAHEVTLAAFAVSIPIGLLVVNILVVNNLRDIPTDRLTGKRTLAVRFGAAWTRDEYLVVVGVAYLVPLLGALAGLLPWWGLLSWFSIPNAVQLVENVFHEEGRALNQTLAGSGQLVLFYALLFSVGMLIARVIGV